MKLKTILVIWIVGLLGACCESIFQGNRCGVPDAGSFVLNDTIRMKVGRYYCNPENELLLVCDSVVEDSRCPTGVECVWEGNGRVRFVLEEQDSQTHEFNLNTHPDFRTDTVINDFRYRLIGLEPYPELGVDFTMNDYTALLVVSSPNLRVVEATITSGTSFEYSFGFFGDEEGLTIISYPEHAEICELLNAPWEERILRYVPEEGFQGSDTVVVKTMRGSDGASPNDDIETTTIILHVRD